MEAVVPLILVIAAAAGFYLWYSAYLRERSLRRVDVASTGLRGMASGASDEPAVFPPRYRLLAPAAGLTVALAVYFLTSLPFEYAVAFGILAAAIAWVFEDWLAARRATEIETQLADAIDLMVGALRAGTGILAALEAAYVEARDPFRSQLRDLIGRIRLGDDPVEAIQSLARRVPLETFRFFATSFSVHWETGGSMAQTLTSIGRTIRDRIEMSRRIQAQSVEVHASVVAVMAISYAVTLIMWRANPGTLEEFLGSSIGTLIAASAVVLQAVGILWISRMSRVRF